MEKKKESLKSKILLGYTKLKCTFYRWQFKQGRMTQQEVFVKTLEAFIDIAETKEEIEMIRGKIERLKKEGYLK